MKNGYTLKPHNCLQRLRICEVRHRDNKLKKHASAYLLYTLLVAVFLVGCEPEYNKKYIVSKSDDNNWTTIGVIECDSVTMVNKNKATLWVDGQKLNLEGRLIKIFSNSDYVAPK